MKVYLFKKGQTLAGGSCLWLDLDDDEDAEELVAEGKLTQNQADMHDEDGYITAGFFGSVEEAKAHADKEGWEITNLDNFTERNNHQ
jgi:hypothetical protein